VGNQSALQVRENEMKSEGTRTTSLYTSLGERGVSVLPLHEKQPFRPLVVTLVLLIDLGLP
jgi:hypothetical protein